MQRSARNPGFVAYVFGALNADAVPGPAMIALLGDLGIAEPAARTLLSRMVRDGQLASERRGRVAVYRMQGGFRDIFLRVRDSDTVPTWDGAFQTVVYEIPETRRSRRDALRDRADDAGFGQVRPGVLIGLSDPGPWLEPWLKDDDVFVESGRLVCTVDTARMLADRAWSLSAKAVEHREFHSRLRAIERRCRRRPPSGKDAFALVNDVLRKYAHLHMATPSLPAELTPPDWPGRDISSMIDTLMHLLGPACSAHVDAVLDRCDVRDLIVPLRE